MTNEMKCLLEWLATGPGQYGECHGKTLDAALANRWAEVKRDGDQSSFIAKSDAARQRTDDIMYCPVEITDAGRDALMNC